MKKNFLLNIILLAIIASTCSASAQHRTRGFDTPVECAQAVFEALRSQNISAIEESFAIPEMARQFDFRKYCERLQSIPFLFWLPSTTEMGIANNEVYIRSIIYRQLAFSSFLLVNRKLGEEVNSGRTHSPLNDYEYLLISFLEDPSSMGG